MAILLLAADATAIDAERAFAAAAQRDGQWTAFRAFAAEGATMFVPQPVDAHDHLRPLKDPPRAVEWSPAAAYESCDGLTAATTGPWTRPDGSTGYFSTLWQKPADGQWKWLVDGGDTLASPRAAVARPKIERASCAKAPIPSPPPKPRGGKQGGGASRDRSLTWLWQVAPDGARTFVVKLWTGDEYRTVIDDKIAAPRA